MNYNSLEVGINVRGIDKNFVGLLVLTLMGSSVTLEGVYVSPLLASKFNNDDNTDFVFNHNYISDNNSEEYKGNPMTLIKYKTEDGDFRYYLTLVNKAKTDEFEYTLPTGVKVKAFKNYYYAKKDWYRFIDSSNDAFSPVRVKLYDDTHIVEV